MLRTDITQKVRLLGLLPPAEISGFYRVQLISKVDELPGDSCVCAEIEKYLQGFRSADSCRREFDRCKVARSSETVKAELCRAGFETVFSWDNPEKDGEWSRMVSPM